MAGQIDAIYKQSIEISPRETNKSDEDNTVYCEEIAQKLKRFCQLLPVWSAIMVPIFGYGEVTESSAASEGSFNDIKHRIFGARKKLPVRADDFVTTHCDAIIGKMNLVKSESLPADSKDEHPQPTISDEDLTDPDQIEVNEKSPDLKRDYSAEENWRGLNQSVVPLKKRRINIVSSPEKHHAPHSDQVAVPTDKGETQKTPIVENCQVAEIADDEIRKLEPVLEEKKLSANLNQPNFSVKKS